MTSLLPDILDGVLMATAAGCAVARCRAGLHRLGDRLTWLAGGLALLQLMVGNPRWQLLPLYGACAALVSWTLQSPPPASLPDRGRRVRRTIGLTSLALVAGSGFLVGALPLLRMPDPGGTFAIGVRDVSVDDSLAVRIWYPRDEESFGPSARYIRGPSEIGSIGRRLGLHPLMLGHLRGADSRSQARARVSDSLLRFPAVIVLAEPSLQPVPLLTRWCRTVASSGYVVAVALPRTGLPTATHAVRILDWFEALRPGDPSGDLANRIDAAQVAVAGIGTAADGAVEACTGDSWFKAAWIAVGDGVPTGWTPTRPVMVVGDDTVGPPATGGLENGSEPLYVVSVRDFRLADLTDLPLICRGQWLGLRERTGTDRAYDPVADHTVAFLDRFLKHAQPDPDVSTGAGRAGVTLKVVRPPSED